MGRNADQAADENKEKLCKARATTVLRDSWCPGRPGPRRRMGGSCVEAGEVDRNKNHDARLLLHIVFSFSFFGSILWWSQSGDYLIEDLAKFGLNVCVYIYIYIWK